MLVILELCVDYNKYDIAKEVVYPINTLQIGRASCRERVVRLVEDAVAGGQIKKKSNNANRNCLLLY